MAQASSLVPINQKCGQKIQRILNIGSASGLRVKLAMILLSSTSVDAGAIIGGRGKILLKLTALCTSVF